MQILYDIGYRNVSELIGGFSAWYDAGYDITPASEQTITVPSIKSVYQPWLGLKVGESAVDFQLKDTRGEVYRLSELLAEKPVMLQFGSYT